MKALLSDPLSWPKKLGLRLPRKGLKGKVEERRYWHRFDAKLEQNIPVVIYQIGKVASSSVYFSLKQVYPGIFLYAHSFQPDHRDWQIRRLYKRVLVERKPLNIISLTREPVGRNVSAFFENFERDTGTRYGKHHFSMMELWKLFLENYDHEIPLVWFDKHIAEVFDIDVFATPFPDCGVESYQEGNRRLLVMKSEIADGFKVSAIRDFLNLPKFDL